MNKNLKKVISAVAALAMSVSSFAALTVSAANYPDIPADANYKHAVDELTALEIVVGDENGNFNPDQSVTRAEFAKMVVCMLNRTQMAESAANQTSRFPDVNDVGTGNKHWASGFITALTGDGKNGIITGFDDGLFRPDETVSYVQAMKMLVCSAGYESWAKSRGGWPNGYLSMANEIGIGDGVTAADNDALTRAQCAQMVANTLRAPVLVETGKTNWDGSLEVSQKNKTGINWQSILTKNQDAYVVYGRVTETSKTASGSMDADEVRFQVERAQNFEDEYYTRNDDPIDFVANVGDTDAADQLRVYSEAIVQVNSNGEYKLICLQPLSTNAEVSFKAENFASLDDVSTYKDTYEETGRFYVYGEGSSKTTSYKLNMTEGGDQFDGTFYVNGVDVTSTATFDELVDDYIVNNGVGDVTLIAESATGSTASSGNYNTIMVTYYKDAVVSDVEGDDDEVKVYLSAGEDELAYLASLTIDYTDEETDYDIRKSGEKINAIELQENDVLSIAWDVTVSDPSDSLFLDIMVSDMDPWTGKYSTQSNKDDKLRYKLDGTYYDVAGIVAPMVTLDDAQRTYTVYFDVFGRIAASEEGTSDLNLAILDNIYKSGDRETWIAKLIYKDGTSGTVNLGNKLDDDTNVLKMAKFVYKTVTGVNTDGVITTDTSKYNPEERVIQYRTNSSGDLTSIKYYTNNRQAMLDDGYTSDEIAGSYSTADQRVYREATGKIGSYSISENTAAVVRNDEANDWEISYLDLNTLIDDEPYTGYFYERSGNGDYTFAIIVDESTNWSKSTRMAAYVGLESTSDENYEYALQVLSHDSKDKDDIQSIYVSEDYDGDVSSDVSGIAEGDPIIFKTDASGAVTEVMSVYPVPGSYSDFKYDMLVAGDLSSIVKDVNDEYSNEASDPDSDDLYKIVVGLVTLKKGNSIDIVTDVTDSVANTNNIESYSMTDDTAVYVRNFSGRSRDNSIVTKGTVGSIRETTVPKLAWLDKDKTLIDLDSVSNPQYVIARVLGDDIMEIMTFVEK